MTVKKNPTIVWMTIQEANVMYISKKFTTVISAACLAALIGTFSYSQRAGSTQATVPANYPASKEWPTYGHDSGGMRFSPLTQITSANVSDLSVAWVYHLKPQDYVASPRGGRGGRGGGDGAATFTGSEGTSLVAGGMMYIS